MYGHPEQGLIYGWAPSKRGHQINLSDAHKKFLIKFYFINLQYRKFQSDCWKSFLMLDCTVLVECLWSTSWPLTSNKKVWTWYCVSKLAEDNSVPWTGSPFHRGRSSLTAILTWHTAVTTSWLEGREKGQNVVMLSARTLFSAID